MPTAAIRLCIIGIRASTFNEVTWPVSYYARLKVIGDTLPPYIEDVSVKKTN